MFRLTNIVKSYGATRAVDDVSLSTVPGEILAVVGENGAGKTTLMRIAAGEIAADAGAIERHGRVELVHQHFLLVDELTIAENLALASPTRFHLATRATLERNATSMITASGIRIGEVGRRVAELSVGERSKLELIKAIVRKPATLVLDEPTSVLTPYESQELFEVMRRLAADGTAVVFISHKLPEVLSIAGRVVVMRGGRVVADRPAGETTAEELARSMVELQPADDRQSVHSAARKSFAGESAAFRQQNLTLHHGEIVAIVGVAGNGQTELAGKLRKELPSAGHIPEDRTRDGVVAEMTIAENLALKSKRWRPGDAARHARKMIELYAIRADGPMQLAGSLSGGNQQKVVLARELDPRPRVVIASEPTRGLDVEAMRFVHGQLRASADGGAAILLLTSDLDEAFALAGAIHVIYRGKLSERMTPEVAAGRVASLMAGIA